MSIHIYTFNQVYYLFLSIYIYIYICIAYMASKKKKKMYCLYDLLKNLSLYGKLNEHQYIYNFNQ